MSQGESIEVSSSQPLAGASHRICHLPEKGWERAWLWASERINPIVVKEVRQSLKSKQFTASFGLTLMAAVAWTLIAVAMMVPRIYYLPGGIPLLTGFFFILAVPLMVIIPYSAFRSLTSETEDSTFELLSISALSSRQIVLGKMASSCLQIVLYLSALTPCIVLTYLLRGVGLFTILFLLGGTILFSVVETAIALLLGAVARTRMTQTGMSVLALAGLLLAVFAWLAMLVDAGLDSFSNPPQAIYLVLFALLTVVGVAISLVLKAASAAIDFPSENHSTPLRWRVLGLVTLTFFWILFAIIASQEEDIAAAFLVGMFVFAMVLGALITGERGVISPRAQRTLPATFLGRVFLTWLYPGAGLGTIYLICLFAALVAALAVLVIVDPFRTGSTMGDTAMVVGGYLLLCYLTIYVGLNRILMLLIPRGIPNRMVGSVALMAAVLVFAHLVPLFTVFYFNDFREFEYGWHQAFNIVWSVTEVFQYSNFISPMGASLVLVTMCALVIFGLNLLLSTRDVMLVRVSEPPRVREDRLSENAVTARVADPFGDQ